MRTIDRVKLGAYRMKQRAEIALRTPLDHRTHNPRINHERKVIFIHIPKISHINYSNHEDYRFYYDDDTRRLVAERFKWSIERYGYTFD